MKILVIYTDTEIVSAIKVEEDQQNSVTSPESFACGRLQELKSFFILKHFDITPIENLENEN